MNLNARLVLTVISVLTLTPPRVLIAQSPDFPPRPQAERPPADFPDDFDGPRRPFDGPGRGGPGGPGGPMQPELKVVKKFDTNGDKWLDATERKAAREYVRTERASNPGRRGPGGPGGPGGRRGPGPGNRGEAAEPPKTGPKVAPADVKASTGTNLYDPTIVRTVFLQFENADWEKELADFSNTDVDVPATVTMDGRAYNEVGVHFRGASSYFTVGEGSKRSLNLSFDAVHEKQKVLGYRTLNLLNSHEDSSFLRTVLYCEIARQYIPAPRANFVKVVINGESWGVYVSAQQFNKDFTRDQFGSTQGARWKVPGSPRGRGSLAYLGDDVGEYRGIYEIRSKDDPKAWSELIRLCRVLQETPADRLEAALAPILDIDGALHFLALENALINNDGYWVRSSDYNLFRDEQGRFHLVPHDANETFSLPGGPGFGRRGGGGRPGGGFDGPGPDDRPQRGLGFGDPPNRGPGGDGVKLDPLTGADDTSKPLLAKLLAVPALRDKYLGYVRDIATRWLDWKNLGPIATRYHELIAADVAADTRKLATFESFRASVAGGPGENSRPREGGFGPGPGPGRRISLKEFADQRRAYLLERLNELEKR